MNAAGEDLSADVFVVRHADAGSRERFSGDDRTRPLSAKGHRQAEAVAERLAARPGLRLASSPAARCVATLEPLAALLGLRIDVCEELAEGRNARIAYAYLRETAETLDGGALAVCTHGDILTGLLEMLVADGTELLNEVNLAKAATLELSGPPPVFATVGFVPPPHVPRPERVRE